MKQKSHITLEAQRKNNTDPGATLDFSFKNMRTIKGKSLNMQKF
jgi:hypothetical protein